MILLLLLLPGLLGDSPPHPVADPHVSCTCTYSYNPIDQGSSPAVLYLPLGGGVSPGCQSAAGAKLTQVQPIFHQKYVFLTHDDYREEKQQSHNSFHQFLLRQLVPLMFAGMTFTIFDAVANINNRINSNNNNNNNQNINFQQSVNTVVTGNINVANQVSKGIHNVLYQLCQQISMLLKI